LTTGELGLDARFAPEMRNGAVDVGAGHGAEDQVWRPRLVCCGDDGTTLRVIHEAVAVS
jgi:hypothetical protein